MRGECLTKGLKFSIAPRHIPVPDIVSSVESAIYKLPPTKQDEFRWTSRPKPNLSSDKLKAIETLKFDPSIVILPADNCRTAVTLDRAEYDNKITDLIITDRYMHTSG
ncbi:hypothetical protein PR048_003455 [Dryococelus australis]|uniref:Uncharacterized protein n=1 Tax=Dryococelus australis TaxID=614101 RepID=A0ABQ9IN41_9NEOP|nr:hypothetical protein PR048_003455 [Dryococelus australis]